jgi:hypothetical protein
MGAPIRVGVLNRMVALACPHTFALPEFSTK